MPSFKGQYEHSVDAKGRVAFPAKLRKSLSPSAQERFTMVRGQEPCLYLYPEDEWAKVEEKLSRINNFTKKGRVAKRNFLRYAEDVSLDKQNRIALPNDLTSYAKIDGKAVFLGMGDYIEVWDPSILEKIDESLDDEAYEEIFEQVMGDEPEDDGA
ncbi:division/cell wall cluster transcriptional repressor MraZ [Gracilimonas mengyeensis]|uniref:Transcriptional regulator MraZ n=1 Tax=Gracilimonas mengyeensis TaxID=1302730 RepID=A0A521E1C7_9BACT|nr:division/cell wall cluster transcriptional repressor MraZ [Gracilimonas mengyeensis]SMO77756.1 MraZ protein [Gracilimonas mengyeensis]